MQDDSKQPDPAQDEFSAAFGEPLSCVLDLNTWRDGADLAEFYSATRDQVAEAIAQERRTREPIRERVFARLRAGSDPFTPKAAGRYEMNVDQITEVHRGLLFNGGTECCDGTRAEHDSVLLSIVQIGIALVAYQGRFGTWVHRLYRRDLRASLADPVEEAFALLERRARRTAQDDSESSEPFSRLVRRALMEYAERAALADLSTAVWRMGHGNPVPSSARLATTPELVSATIEVLRKLILDHRRFVYVVSEPSDQLLLTLGNALYPLEFAIVGTLADQFTDAMLYKLAETQRGHPVESRRIQEFFREVRFEVVTGVYRAGQHAPARAFYAHKDFACEAAAIAMADSMLQPYRGFPMLIDLADTICSNAFDGGSFRNSIQDAYAAAGEPTRYLGERETRVRL